MSETVNNRLTDAEQAIGELASLVHNQLKAVAEVTAEIQTILAEHTPPDTTGNLWILQNLLEDWLRPGPDWPTE